MSLSHTSVTPKIFRHFAILSDTRLDPTTRVMNYSEYFPLLLRRNNLLHSSILHTLSNAFLRSMKTQYNFSFFSSSTIQSPNKERIFDRL